MLNKFWNYVICFGRNHEFKNRVSFITKEEREARKVELIRAFEKYKE